MTDYQFNRMIRITIIMWVCAIVAGLLLALLSSCARSPCSEQTAQDNRARCLATQGAIIASKACNAYSDVADCPALKAAREDCDAARERWIQCR